MQIYERDTHSHAQTHTHTHIYNIYIYMCVCIVYIYIYAHIYYIIYTYIYIYISLSLSVSLSLSPSVISFHFLGFLRFLQVSCIMLNLFLPPEVENIPCALRQGRQVLFWEFAVSPSTKFQAKCISLISTNP